ncbi:MAG TPA: heavy metal-binding domain-containing protein [Vicinamibacterales bacterium]|nr:heavy metal-binding domain-containing protein [Vicinamibacterales bacterium]
MVRRAAIAAAVLVIVFLWAPGSSSRIAPTRLVAAAQAVFWCPMHPNVRGRDGDKCPQCGMMLVRAARADYAGYLVDLETSPRVLRPQQKARARIFVRDPHTKATVRRFDPVHERVFHLFIISQDLEYFAHVHPTLHRDGSLDVDIQLPKTGVYQLIADFLPSGGSPQLVQKSIVTAGYAGPLVAPPRLARDTGDKIVGDMRVTLTMPEPIAGREQLVTFELHDAASGAPVTDLEPYLGAAGHLLFTSADLAIAAHSHPVVEISARGGPTVVFQMLFPREGDYRMWVQFQRRGEVLTSSFTVPVLPSP